MPASQPGEIAPGWQATLHAPQSVHLSASITAFSSFMAIASAGHAATQSPQPLHSSLSTTYAAQAVRASTRDVAAAIAPQDASTLHETFSLFQTRAHRAAAVARTVTPMPTILAAGPLLCQPHQPPTAQYGW